MSTGIPVYAQHATPDFSRRLHGVLQCLARDISASVGENCLAVVLGGGYGRGEGAVVMIQGKEHPYNDLDLFLVTRRKWVRSSTNLPAIRHSYEKKLGVEVDIGPPQTLADIRRWPSWLMWYDLLNGHVVLEGAADVITKHVPNHLRSLLPPVEATRLLLNRGAGLLLAMQVDRGVLPAPDRDFVRRNYYKCALALGDALLIVHGLYTTAYRGRDSRFEQLAGLIHGTTAPGLLPLYRRALSFKFAPGALPDEQPGGGELSEMAKQWGEVLLYVERNRLGGSWGSLEEYARWGGRREPGAYTLGRLLRAAYQNLKAGALSWQHPRERLLMRMPALLIGASAAVEEWEGESNRILSLWRQSW